MREAGEWDASFEVDARGLAFKLEPVADAIIEATEANGGVASFGDGWIGIDVTVESASAIEAIFAARGIVTRAVVAAGLPADLPIERVEAKSRARAVRDLERPTYPEMLGAAEVADTLGVSRQRVDELRRAGRLPEPIAELRASPVWPRPAIDRFLETWERKPGRPRHVSAG